MREQRLVAGDMVHGSSSPKVPRGAPVWYPPSPTPLNPPLDPACHLPLIRLDIVVTVFLFLSWGGGPDTLTPSHPSLGLLAVRLVSGDLCCPSGYSSLPLPLHRDAPNVSGTFFLEGCWMGALCLDWLSFLSRLFYIAKALV